MKKILAPTDFSETARNSIEYAVRLAIQANAQLVLFHAYHMPALGADVPATDLNLEEMARWSYSSLHAIREDIYYRHGQGIEVECVCRCGFAAEEINDFALEYDADMIVVGMQGADFISEAVIGSVSTAIMREAPCPVLVIDRNLRFTEIRKLVFACDYIRPPRRETFDALKGFMGLFRNPWVYIVHVTGNGLSPGTALEALSKPRIREYLHHEGHSFHTVEGENIVEGLQQFAAQHQADLIVMVPHRYSFWRGIFYSPLSKRMAFHTRLPLLIL